MGLLAVPNELTLLIGECLSIRDLSHFLSTCHQLNSALSPLLYQRGNAVDGQTPLHWAALHGNKDLVELAISRGAEIDKPNRKRLFFTALHLAAAYDHPDVIRVLIKKGATTSAKDKHGNTPLHLAANRTNRQAISSLLEQRAADMTCLNNNGDTPVHCSVARRFQRDLTCLPLFIDAGFDLNTRGHHGNTILHVAASFFSPDVVRYLLQEKVGIPINARNCFGRTALDDTQNPNSLAWGTTEHPEVKRLLIAATKQVEGGEAHTCLDGCYHTFSL